MRIFKQTVWHLLPIAVVAIMLSGGCRDRRAYHDPYYNDDHPAASEQPYYNRWEQDTRRTHQDLDKRSQDEQKQYWNWRHQQH